MAKNYRREKIVKFAKGLERRRENFIIRYPDGEERFIKIYEMFGFMADDLMRDIIRALCDEFDIERSEVFDDIRRTVERTEK